MTTAIAKVAAPVSDPGSFGAFHDLRREHGFEPLRVEGRLPEDLAGTLFRAGPSLFTPFGRRYPHWFDGDGAISAVRFRDGSAEGAVRLVETRALIEERRVGKVTHAGFGVLPEKRRLFMPPLKNAANTSVLPWNGRLLALWEAGFPTELRPEDLTTLGETDLDGVVVKAFSAHPHRVAARRTTYNFGIRYGLRTVMDLYALPDDGPARRLGSPRRSTSWRSSRP